MTKAAAHFGKDLSHFMRSPDTREYVDALNSAKNAEYVETSRGRHGGTWAHPKLAVFFARWLDVRFSVWCDAVIGDILKGPLRWSGRGACGDGQPCRILTFHRKSAGDHMDRENKGARYTTLMASDIQRDGMGLEMHRTTGGMDSVVAEVFYSDADCSWTLNTFDCNVPLELIEELVTEARLRLPPKAG